MGLEPKSILVVTRSELLILGPIVVNFVQFKSDVGMFLTVWFDQGSFQEISS